jgi:hypothetical protein
MTIARNPLLAGLCLLALHLTTPAAAHGLPSSLHPMLPTPIPGAKPSGNTGGPVAEPLLNGRIEVDPGCASEFPHWTKVLEFYDRPDAICVRWLDKTPVEWARWELYKDLPGDAPSQKIASGEVPQPTLPNPSAKFKIQLKDFLPLHNGGKTNQKYFVKVQSKAKLSDVKPKSASQATLVHKPKGGQPVPPLGNPYSCSGAPAKYTRQVTLDIPKMTVNQTTSTSGDGDRDELYISIGRLGPGTDTKQTRLPSADDYYEAHNGETVTPGPNGWTNKDQAFVNSPVLYKATLGHNQVVDLAVAVQEQDNSDLKDIKAGIITAMHTVAGVAGAVGGYGAIVAAVAEGVAGAAQLIPNTKNHDVIGFVGLRLTNKCGYIQTTWTTFASKSIPGVGTLTNEFVSVGTHDKFESRLAVLAAAPSFWPDGVDYKEYEYTGNTDEFFWIANGTSSSKYTFVLRSRVADPG